jgi:hypothetical protein
LLRGFGAPDARRRPVEVHDLPGGKNPRVAGEHLLHQRGAGARHADDEDRQVRGLAEPLFAAQQFRCECRRYAAKDVEGFRLVVSDLPSLQRVPLDEVAERLLIPTEVFVGLRQREMQLDPPLGRLRPHGARQLLHGAKMRIIRGEALALGETAIELGLARVQRDRLLECRLRLLEPSQRPQRVAAQMMRPRIVRIAGKHCVVTSDRFLGAFQGLQRTAEIIVLSISSGLMASAVRK